jgi:hypothetical protein
MEFQQIVPVHRHPPTMVARPMRRNGWTGVVERWLLRGHHEAPRRCVAHVVGAGGGSTHLIEVTVVAPTPRGGRHRGLRATHPHRIEVVAKALTPCGGRR